MLRSLYVKDFAIVGEVEIAFGPGLTVVTGETGAGKSLLVDALLMLAGNRAESSLVRHGCERAELSAEFDLAQREDLREWLREEELDDDNACQLRRVLRSEGTSRAWINGRPVTLTQMKALGDRLIEIHGQHEHQALLERSQQLGLLDAFGGHADALAEVRKTAIAWRTVVARIKDISRGEDHAERIEWLNHQVSELDTHALTAEALAELEESHKRLANSGQLLQGCAGLADLLDGDSEFSISRLIARAHGESQRLAMLDPALTSLGELLDAARIHVDESVDTLSRYQSSLDLDPERYAEVDAQLGTLHELSRKHRVNMAELTSHGETLRQELESLRDAGTELVRLERERRELKSQYQSAAKELSKARLAAARKLGDSVTELLSELGMSGGRFQIELEPTANEEPEIQGAERCEFMVSANPGQPVRALRKVASGGELSRISLAIEVAALGHDDVGTMVFDEVDSGIGGAVAEVVGQKLRRLGSQRQVLCVTHLAQVAAQGHAHLQVSKSAEDDNTETGIEQLNEKSRRDEIARMLGGIEITKETLAHAKQMLQVAQSGD
ncbi:MAG TPA: DNA repair protein RecN [Dokdonella sp.]|uniref:DNA repair protein RecN n=1 Tax=Dokdonella sp. TaxID=2291710 RepID=UPI002D7EBAC0|nr:DNA repair protein RecN [Dokdonella sp.]HET9032778.1 DNA repair protein RecN [Dokdonella sp.]